MAMNPEFYNKFKKDAMKILQLNHDNIVTVYDIAGLYRTIFIFREYLEGEPLHKILDKMPQQPLNRVIEFLLQICSGLAYSHKHGLIHQGIKPTNIFILPNNQVKLIDFGMAFPRWAIDASLGEMVQYMSPEQIAGEHLDEKTDIYSLGITAFEMITGERPVPDHNIDKSTEMHAIQEIPDPRSLRPDLPDGLCRVVIKASKNNPDERYQSVSEIISDLKDLAGI
jgi:serine/threonine protein kinase